MRTRKWWMLGVTCLSVVVVSVDLTILNIALPVISTALHADNSDLQWLVDAYALVFAGVMVPAGLVGDRLGRKRLLLVGMAVFLAASVWCALASSAGELIVARAVMGLGAGIVFPLSLAVISAGFGDDERPTAIGILTAGVALALPLGPVLGGVLLEHFSWQSVFWINVPVACLGLAVGTVLMTESRNPAAPALDGPGALLPTAGTVCLVWGIISGPERGWTSPATWALLAGSVILVAAFVLRDRRATARLVHPALFRDRRFFWGSAATVAVSVALFATMFVLPQYLQNVVGDDPISAGLRLLPMMGGLLVMGAVAGHVVKVTGTSRTVAIGLALLAAGLALLSDVHRSTGYPVVAIGLTLCGLGIGASMSAAMNAVMAAVGGDEAGIGASLNSALRQVGGAITVAVLGGVLASSYAGHLRGALSRLPPQAAAAARGSIAQAEQVASHLTSGGAALRAAAGTAFLHGMSAVMLICAAIAVLAIPTSLRYLPGRAASDVDASPSPAPPAGTPPPATTASPSGARR